MPRAFAALAAAAMLSACADLGHYVWVQDYLAPPPDKGFVIAPGDMLQVRMFGQETFTTRAKVRSDGKISLPLLNDLDAAGYTPAGLGAQLETRYRDFVKVPAVTVSVEEAHQLSVPVAGEVGKQGIVTADRGATLLQILLLAGGLTDYAHKDRIFVVRGGAQPARIRFRWDALVRGDGAGARFEIRAGDTVVVE